MPDARRRRSLPFLAVVLGLLVGAVAAGPVAASPPAGSGAFPSTIDLPNGWAPEGIAAGRGTTVYVGSLVDGAIWRGDVRTGEGAPFIAADGDPAVGLEYDARNDRLWVAGGPSGEVRVYDATSGEQLAVYTFAPAGFLNDVVVTEDAAYVTDSSNAWLDVVPLSADGALPDASDAFMLPLSGDWVQATGFNANGIDAARGWLIVVNSTTGQLFRVDPSTGEAVAIDTAGYSVVNGDGLLVRGSTLYVVRNMNNLVALLRLGAGLESATLRAELTAGSLEVPTTVAFAAGSLWAVNARFGVAPGPDVAYWITRLPING